MSVLPIELESVMQEFEVNITPLEDHDVSAAIETIVKKIKDGGGEVGMELAAENIAFNFCEDYRNDQSGWGTFYGPMMVSSKGDKVYEWPSIRTITTEILDYWQQRSKEANHPVLKARYADLVCDLSPKVRNTRAEIACFHTAIDSYANTIRQGLYEHRSEVVIYADRALSLALSINDSSRVEKVRDAILELEGAELPDDDGLAIAFDLLINNKKILLSDEQVDSIIIRVENSLADAVKKIEDDDRSGDPFAAEHAGLRLASYYRRLCKQEEVCRVLQQYAKAFLLMANKAAPMLGAAWLNKVFDILNEFGCREEADAVAPVLRELGMKSKGQLVKHTEKIEIPKEEIGKFIDAVLEGSVEDALIRITVYFTPDPNKIEKQVKDIAKSAPLMSLMSISLIDADGRETGKIGSVEEDLEGRVIQHMGQNMQFEGQFLRWVLSELAERHKVDADVIVNHVFKSPLFEKNRRSTIKRGIEACLAGDHLVAVHLLVPQIEQALRRLVVLSGRSAYKPNRRRGGIQVKVLDDLLRDEAVTKALTDQRVKYLKVMLTDPRGWNLRNDICHGIINPEQLGWGSTDRVLHVLLVLAGLRQNGHEDSETPHVEDDNG